jgi:hypothetical protein
VPTVNIVRFILNDQDRNSVSAAESDRRHALADIEVEPLGKRGMDGPATHRQDLRDGLQDAEHPAVLDPHDAPSPIGRCTNVDAQV